MRHVLQFVILPADDTRMHGANVPRYHENDLPRHWAGRDATWLAKNVSPPRPCKQAAIDNASGGKTFGTTKSIEKIIDKNKQIEEEKNTQVVDNL